MDRTVYVVHSHELLVCTNETVTIKSIHDKCENIQTSNVLIICMHCNVPHTDIKKQSFQR
jgi:hypothetical protein